MTSMNISSGQSMCNHRPSKRPTGSSPFLRMRTPPNKEDDDLLPTTLDNVLPREAFEGDFFVSGDPPAAGSTGGQRTPRGAANGEDDGASANRGAPSGTAEAPSAAATARASFPGAAPDGGVLGGVSGPEPELAGDAAVGDAVGDAAVGDAAV